MLTVTALVLLLSQTGPDKVVDVSAKKADFGVLTDGKGHYVVYNATQPLSGPTFYGDGKTFHLVPVVGGGASGTESWEMSLWDPRVVGLKQNYASMSMRDEGKVFEVTCNETTTTLTRLAKEEATKLVDAAAFRGSRWTRQPTHLFRDDTGTYYLVDRLRTDDGNDRRDWRVFMGPRGKMKLAALKDVVDDDQGQIFATRDGSLRLVTGTGETKWVKGKAETKLTQVDLGTFRNARMVYVDLGPYVGQKLGTPCDDIL